MRELTDRLDEIGDLYGGSLIQTIDDAIADASTCIKRLGAENKALRESIENALLCDTLCQMTEALQAALEQGEE